MEEQIDDLEDRARSGDRAAFNELIRLWDDDLRGVAWSIVEDDHAADEVMQNAYLKSYVSLAKFNGRSSLKTWMHSICYRTAVDHVRYESYRSHRPLETASDTTTSHGTEKAVAAKWELEELLTSLKPEQRAMLMLTAGLGYSFDETAEIVDKPPGTVRSTVASIRRKAKRWSET